MEFQITVLRCLTIFTLGFSTTGEMQSPPQPRGSICGSVQDENGQPAADTSLIAMYLGAHSGPMPGARTDPQGHYCVQGLAFGDYRVSADDEDKGYPDMSGLFFAQHPSQTDVLLTSSAPDGHVDVPIPYKAGFLNLLPIDAESGNALRSMSVRLAVRTDTDHRSMSISTYSERSILVPPSEDVILNVTAPGYGTWPNDGSKGMLVNLLPGEQKTIKVPLRKTP